MTAPPTATPLSDPDWAEFHPANYLNEYYADLGPENTALLRFLVEAFRDGGPRDLLLDFGGGPTIYPLLAATPHFREIHFSDYLEANLNAVHAWLQKQPGAFDWSDFTRIVLELESGCSCRTGDVIDRENETRRRVTRVLRCDAGVTPSIHGALERYDTIVSNFCAESATNDLTEWQLFTRNIARLLKPQGRLIVTALKGATTYSIGSRSFPAVHIDEEDLIELLLELGFSSKDLVVQSVPADRPSRHYSGLIFAAATKEDNSNPSRLR